MAPLGFCRPGESRQAEWGQFDLDGEHPAYTVPPMIRKLRKAAKENPNTPPHIVPLSTQAIPILRDLQQVTGCGRYLFPGARSASRNMSDGAVNAALARLGYKGILVGHGFRHMACSVRWLTRTLRNSIWLALRALPSRNPPRACLAASRSTPISTRTNRPGGMAR